MRVSQLAHESRMQRGRGTETYKHNGHNREDHKSLALVFRLDGHPEGLLSLNSCIAAVYYIALLLLEVDPRNPAINSFS